MNCPSYLDTCCNKDNIDLHFELERSVKILASCGTRQSDGVGYRITGGSDHEAQFGEFPWMVALFVKESNKATHIYKCGGSLINQRVVLTAAHCVAAIGDYKIRVGEWDSQTTREILKHQDMGVNKIIKHSMYDRDRLKNDIALLFLKDDVSRASHVNVICLPSQNFVATSKECIVTGWGKDKFDAQGTYQAILKKIELPIVPRSKCQDAFRSTRLGRTFNLHPSFICAGGKEGEDSCSGDGGGPLICPIEGTEDKYHQVGIVSWGIGCGTNKIPGAYVDVAKYKTWIDKQLKNNL